MSNPRSRLSPDAKSDLIFTIPREYAEVVGKAVKMRGLTSLSGYGRIVVFESLRGLGLVDQHFQPVAQEDGVVPDKQELPV